jgi:glycosyltransferase involved in cell wall biosynthesis
VVTVSAAEEIFSRFFDLSCGKGTQSHMANGFRLSVAIPIHNEESVLPELQRRLHAVLDGLTGGHHEMVFVYDGSADHTFDMLDRAPNEDSRIWSVRSNVRSGIRARISTA